MVTTTREDLIKVVALALEDEARQVEVEGRFRNVTVDQFTRVCQYFQRHASLSPPVDTVDVVFVGGKRYTIPDVALASEVLVRRAPMPPDVVQQARAWPCVKKTALQRLELPSFDVVITAKREAPVEDAFISTDLASRSGVQLVRLKRRYSSQLSGGALRADLTVVQEARTVDVIVAGKAERQYEIEVEVLQQKKAPAAADLTDELLATISVIVQVIQNTRGVILTSEEASRVRQAYQRLASHAVDRRPSGLIGPQPVTIQRANLQRVEDGALDQVSILDGGYAVTDKADGERGLLYIDSTGACFVLDGRLRVTATGCTCSSHTDCILDVEVLPTLSTVLIFDAYVVDGAVVATLPLISTGDPLAQDRVSLMRGLAQATTGDTTVQVKEHVPLKGDDPFAACRVVLNKKGRAYRTDGLIFTPTSLGAGCDLPGQKHARLQGAWHRQLKWKPPEENTIDFLVRFEGRTVVKDGDGVPRAAIRARLFVGFNPVQDAPITPQHYVALRTAGAAAQDASAAPARYQSVPFPAPEADAMNLELTSDDGVPRCSNGDIVAHDDVVECGWGDRSGWRPIRVRTDKQTGNNVKIAMDNWRSIQEPVLEQHITGKEPSPPPSEDRGAVYYARSTTSTTVGRADLGTSRLARFHNWVKAQLIDAHKGAGTSLFDVGCGRAGDLRKWADSRVQRVVGVDVTKDNLENPNGGAYARLLAYSGPTKCVLLVMDATKPLHDQQPADEEYADLAGLVWGRPAPSVPSKARKFFQKDFAAAAVRGFDVVTCQFALHYFMKDEDTLHVFADNVKRLLKPGGRFVATCLDGRRVHALLRKKKAVVRGTLWGLERAYPEAAKPPRFGAQVDVYIDSINQRIPEYLVDPGVVEEVFAKHDLTLDEGGSGSFQDMYDMWPDPTRMTPEEEELSFLNMWLAFRKA